ncbi:MAG: hypothetical protein GX313_04455 [Spirochaetales bacterium]|nr:hypothetical protein [Spirochaetales bacterium]
MKKRMVFTPAAPREVIEILVNHPSRFGPAIGQSWDPNVADFLIEMYPEAIEQGFGLEDILMMVAEDEEA